MTKRRANRSSASIDWGTVVGVILALGGILGGLVLEGGHIQDVAQITAAAIVLGGTIGAVLISKPLPVVMSACARLRDVVFPPPEVRIDQIIEHFIEMARQVRRHGIACLEDEARKTTEPFLRKALGIAADGLDSRELRRIMELEIEIEQRRYESDAGVFEAGGGYAPTIGIIGAVLGLIQVMKHLDHLEEVGRGIAVAFVATVYGVSLANIFLLPFGAKIQARGKQVAELRELVLAGVLAIAAGTNPRLIQLQLEAYRPKSQVKEADELPSESAKVAQIG
jgi:chemotaxis protein MotA